MKEWTRPTFVIGGAPRSGTTYLCEALAKHPEVYLPRPFIPEPKVLMGAVQELDVYRERYQKLLGEGAAYRVRGEKTSYYLECGTACGLLHQLVPDVKLIFILREPVGRAYSNWLWSTKNGLEKLPFEEAVSLEGKRKSPLPPEKAYARPFDYLTRGDYAALAKPYIEKFGMGQLHFCLYENIERAPEELMTEMQRFIGVEPLAFEEIDAGVVNSARETGPPIDRKVEAALRERMRPLVAELSRVTGLDTAAWGY